MGISYDPEFSDVLGDAFVGGSLSVTATAVEAKVGASRLERREFLVIHNSSNNTVYYGPDGVTTATGVPLLKDQTVGLPVGDIAVFVIAVAGTNTIRVQEYA